MPPSPPLLQAISPWLPELGGALVLIVLIRMVGRCLIVLIHAVGACKRDRMVLETAKTLRTSASGTRVTFQSDSRLLEVAVDDEDVRPPAPGSNVVLLEPWRRRDRGRRGRLGGSTPEDDRRKPAR